MRGITEERLRKKLSYINDEDFTISGGIEENYIMELLDECQELNPWQPIGAAPKDRQIILYTKEYGVTPGQWFPADRTGWWTAHCMPVTPTHWMELPEPPKC